MKCKYCGKEIKSTGGCDCKHANVIIPNIDIVAYEHEYFNRNRHIWSVDIRLWDEYRELVSPNVRYIKSRPLVYKE